MNSDGSAFEPTTGQVRLGDIDLAYLELGEGPLAVLVHGFPDTAWSWRHLMPALADAGYRVVAPFLRGYAPSAVPADGNGQAGAAVADIGGLHEALGGGSLAVEERLVDDLGHQHRVVDRIGLEVAAGGRSFTRHAVSPSWRRSGYGPAGGHGPPTCRGCPE